MLSKDIIKFLENLTKNNNKEWFQENKPTYDKVRKEFASYVDSLIPKIVAFEPGLTGLEAKNCIFRIFRDVRFSKNKLPYKTNFGAFFVKGGRNSGNAGYYFHVEPGASFIGGGIYMPPSDNLKAVRKDIYENVDEFKEIIYNKDFINVFGNIRGEKLKTAPKGFDKNWEDIELLNFKSYTVLNTIPDDLLSSESITNEIIKNFQLMKPLNDFINYAIANKDQ